MTDDSEFRSKSYLLPARARSANILAKSANFENSSSNYFGYDYTPRRQEFNAESFSSVHDIVNARNAANRILDLERSNLKLRRMIQYASIDKLNQPDSARLVETDRDIRFNLSGPPVLRQGRIGSSWRHIKQTNSYSNSNLLFVDGTVRIDDNTRFPPRLYGYPPKVNLATHRQLSASGRSDYLVHDQTSSQHILGLGPKSLTDLSLPVNNLVQNRPTNLNQYENQYQIRAKEGFEYWSKDNRYPENNKPKAKTIAVGHPYFKSGF